MAGYTRQDVSNNIANGNVIDADDLDNEFDAVAAAFDTATGHSHSGAAGDGGPITVLGPAQEYVGTSSSLAPKGNNLYDLGTTTQRWKDFFVAGTATLTNVDINGGSIDNTTIGSATPSSGSFTSVTTTGDLTVGGNFVVDTVNVVTGNFDNASILSADVNGGTIDGTVIGGTTPAAATFTTTTVTDLTANGNIVVTGTVDGVDIAQLKTDFDALDLSVEENQDAFSIVSVDTDSGLVELVADQPQDTLSVAAGTGISLTANTSNDTVTIVNSAPDQVVTLTAGSDIGITGDYPNFTISNTAPGAQQVVINAGTGLEVDPSSSYPVFNLTNTAPDQVVAFTNGVGISVEGTYPNFSITNTLPNVDVNLIGGTGITISGTYPNITIDSTISEGAFYTAGAGLELTGTVFSHADTSAQSSVGNGGDTVIQSIYLDEYGHVTGIGSKTISIPSVPTVNNSTITVSAGTGLSGGGNFTTNQSFSETITLNAATLSSSTWAAGTSSTEAAISPGKLRAASTFNPSATWANFTPTQGQVYQNGTSSPIAINCLGGSNLSIFHSVDAQVWVSTSNQNEMNNNHVVNLTSIIPSGHYYKIDTNSSQGATLYYTAVLAV